MKQFFLNTLVFIFFLQINFVEEPKKNKFEGVFTITLPANRILDSMEIGVDFDKERDLIAQEDHNSDGPQSMVQIGVKSVLTMKKNYRGKLRVKNTRKVESSLYFYLFKKASELKSIYLTPKFYTKGNEFISDGGTEAVFRLDVIEVNNIGDTKGRLIKTLKGIAFELGVENRIDLNHVLTPKKKLAFKLSAESKNDIHVLHFPVRNIGTYPAKYDSGVKENLIEVYNLPLRMIYTIGDNRKSQAQYKIFRKLTEEINKFVRSSSAFGTDEILEIPLKLKMKIAPEEVEAIQRSIAGPIPKKVKKKKRGFFSLGK
ncbi:MAG: hypothetical protein COB02_08020 [Candidatus Cloacimonadota bacterium]|nr:MAG: hypothetical protein COB02_08020 [Candidatus Cloacimonadota bacterium]